MRRRREAIIAAVIVIVGLGAALLIPGVRRLLVSSNTDQAFLLLNKDRVANGHPPLLHQAQLDAYAQNWSNHMLATGVLAHDSIQNHICCWDVLGENVGMGSTLELIEQAFMNSPEHRANILYPTFTQVGIGVAYDSKHQVYFVTQAFRDPSSATAPAPRRTSTSRIIPARTPTPARSPAPRSPPPSPRTSPKPTPSVTPTPSITPSVFVPSPIVTVQARLIRHRSVLTWVLIGLLVAFILGMAVLVFLGKP